MSEHSKVENPILQVALDLLSEGISTIPLKPRSKAPALTTWAEFQRRLPTEEEVRRWFADPNLNLGVICGPVSGNLFVLDFDTPEASKRFAADYATVVRGCPVVKTSRGLHLYLRSDTPVASRKLDSIDVKSSGSYVVGPGSIHPDGTTYLLYKGDLTKTPVVDPELLGLSGNDSGEKHPEGWPGELLSGVPKGQRNLILAQLAGRYISKGLSHKEALELLLQFDAGCTPPQGGKVVKSVLDSITKTHARKQKGKASDILGLFKPENLNILLQDTDAADPARLKNYSGFFFNNPELAYQFAAAVVYHELSSSDGRLARAGNTLHNYTERGHRWRPLIDVTRPDTPFYEIDYLSGNRRVVDIFGSDFKVTDNRTGRVYRRHFNKAKIAETRAFFIGYVFAHAPIDEELLLRRPEKTISTASGLLIFDRDGYRIEDHRPDHGQILPAFPYKYRPWNTVPEDEQDTVIRYLTNLARAVPAEQLAKMVELLGFLIGYTLTPYRTKFFLILIGAGDSGKTLLLELLQVLHGTTGTFVEVDFQQMEQKPTQFDSAAFMDVLLAIHDDFPPGGNLPAQKLKSLANPAKPMTVNQKFKPPVTIINKAAPYISTNEDPQSDDTYLANRLLCVPFETIFNKAEQTAPKTIELVRKMHTPKMQQALFDFGIHCLQRFFREDGIQGYIPPIVQECTDRVAGRLNDVLSWLHEVIEAGTLRENPEGRAGRARLYREYEAGRKYPVKRTTFFTTLRKKYGREVAIQGVDHFRGLEIVEKDYDHESDYEK